ncbi:MAG TPA: hypothetical protein VGI54_12225 [Solirubrobacteraceae bacterium]
MDYEVELNTTPGRRQDEEALTVRFADGQAETMRLHEYERVYAIPGLYEEVVQRRLECASPARLAEGVVAAAAAAGQDAADLRAFDLGAGNGVVGEELAARGVSALVGSDNIAAARDAARRDRPELYPDYLVGELEDWDTLGRLVADRRLNVLTTAGALGLGHIPAGSWLGITVAEHLANPGDGDIGDWLARMAAGEGGTEILGREPFRHRLTMAGDPITYLVVVGRRV